MKNFVLFLLVLGFTNISIAQEIKMNVSVKLPATKTADPRVFQTMERAISDFYNQTQWSSDEFEDEEKIEANLQITIKEELSTTGFIADFVYQIIRPVYDASYSSQLFNHIDKDIRISYTEHQPIQNNRDIYTDNLSSILTFYAYIVLGTDYDSFSPLGGEEYFQIANTIAVNIPANSPDPGWKLRPNKRNRSKLIENILHPSLRPYRQAFYDYHRQSLDAMTDDPLRSRAVMAGALNSIYNADVSYPNSLLIQVFCDSKAEEIVEVFKPAKSGEKRKIYDIMTKLDPAKSEKYFSIKP